MALLAVIRSFAVTYSTMSRTRTGSRGWQITVREPVLTRSVSRHNLNSQLAAQVRWLWELTLCFDKRAIRSHWQSATGQKGKKTASHLRWYSVYRTFCKFIRLINKCTKYLLTLHSYCVVVCIVCFVLFYVLFVCKCVLPPGDNPIAVNKYIISYQMCQQTTTKTTTKVIINIITIITIKQINVKGRVA